MDDFIAGVITGLLLLVLFTAWRIAIILEDIKKELKKCNKQ